MVISDSISSSDKAAIALPVAEFAAEPPPNEKSTDGAIKENVPRPINMIAKEKITISFLYFNRIVCAHPFKVNQNYP